MHHNFTIIKQKMFEMNNMHLLLQNTLYNMKVASLTTVIPPFYCQCNCFQTQNLIPIIQRKQMAIRNWDKLGYLFLVETREICCLGTW